MNGKTTQQRLDDICSRSGMSEDIVRRVLLAERDSILDSLKRGERATLIGRCVIRPDIRSTVNVGGAISNHIKASIELAPAIQLELSKVSEYIDDGQSQAEAPDGIKLQQISALS